MSSELPQSLCLGRTDPAGRQRVNRGFADLLQTHVSFWSQLLTGGCLSDLGGASRARGSRGARGSLETGSRAAKVLGAVRSGAAVAGHAHVMGRGRSGTVGSTHARVVLRATPAEANARVADGVALHLVDGHLSSMTMHKLDEAATLARGDLDVGNLAESLEERAQLIFGDIARKATNEDGGVVGIRELVHLRGRVVTAIREASLHATRPHLLLGHAAAHHGARSALRSAGSAESLVATESHLVS